MWQEPGREVLPGCFGARFRLPLAGSLALSTPSMCCSGSSVFFSSKWSRSLSSVVSSVCVAWVRSNSPLRPSVSNSCCAFDTGGNHSIQPFIHLKTFRWIDLVPYRLWICTGSPWFVIFIYLFILSTFLCSHTSWPHLWCCQTPSASPPLFLQSCPREPTGRTSPLRTLAADAPPHLDRWPWSRFSSSLSPWF